MKGISQDGVEDISVVAGQVVAGRDDLAATKLGDRLWLLRLPNSTPRLPRQPGQQLQRPRQLVLQHTEQPNPVESVQRQGKQKQ